MRSILGRRGKVRSPKGRILTVAAPEFGFAQVMVAPVATIGAGWASANKPLAIPFTITETTTVYQMAWVNGSSAGNNVDQGIYDESWNRIVSTGSTAAGTSLATADVTDTVLRPGRYWLVHVRDNATANRVLFMSHTASAALLAFLGCMDSATSAFPLPDPLTDMVPCATATRIPDILIATRA